ncbi:MAG: chromosomal replication initiator protein DnaA [Planctomycetota bacterium]|nr:MAG: chromosomal replication initiator protein DnaA [Planctomycetota bacterium]
MCCRELSIVSERKDEGSVNGRTIPPINAADPVESALGNDHGSELHVLWPQVLAGLEERFSGGQHAGAVRLWLSSGKVQPQEVKDGVLLLDCPTALFAQQIRRHFTQHICELMTEQAGSPISDVQCRVNRHSLERHRRELQASEAQAQVQRASNAIGGSSRRSQESGFKMLEGFVVGTCNRMAYDAVRRIIESPENPVNPLFIHGASGLGKTHLLQGLAVAFRERYPHSQVLYMTCEQFKHAFLAAWNKGHADMDAFRVSIRHADLLLIDDIHFLSRGEAVATKNEMFSTLNELAGRGKKVVITSDAHPKDIKYLEDRFVQRFQGGLVVMLDRPDVKVRCEVIAAKALSQGAALSPEVVDFVADHITDNVRELEGAVNKLVHYAASFHRKIDLSVARQALADTIGRDVVEPRLKMILRVVADYFDLSVDDVMGKSRSGSRSMARHIAMYVLKHASSDTYAAVGEAFGGKRHSSVVYACEQVAKHRASDPDMDSFINDLLMRVRRG